ncbi:MAG: hypothetical protein OXU20_35745 [Myxococcales bacterium]|nr:hypothetical protein [Myxococcales bacterium]MDD9971121.1 hypothetical protein [Myxococcales bacterium]
MGIIRGILLAGLCLGAAQLVSPSGAGAQKTGPDDGKGGGVIIDAGGAQVPEIGAAGAPAALVLTLGLAALAVERRRRRAAR